MPADGRREADVRERMRVATGRARPWLVVVTVMAIALVEAAGKRWAL